MTGGVKTLQRRKKKSLLARLRVFWIFIVVLLAAAAYGGYTLVTLPQLRVRTVQVTIQGHIVSRREVLAAARVDPQANAWLLDAHAIERRIEAIPYVAQAHVARKPPADVGISVTERVPAACILSGARSVTVDAQPRVLQTGCAHPGLARVDAGGAPLDAPGRTVGAPAALTLLADGKVLADAHLSIRALRRDRFGGLLAVDASGIELRFGSEGDLARKAALVEPVRAATAHGRPIRAIDVRAPSTPTVEFR